MLQAGPSSNGCEKKQDERINVRFKERRSPFAKIKLEPRAYQDELYRKALNQNVIIFLGTGLGKTYITVLYIRSPQVFEEIQKGRKVVFLAPTQDLVKQQADYIWKQVPYRVKIFCGRTAHCGEHIDHWSKAIWMKELDKVDILFMTPMIFSSAISTNLLDWRQFAAVIFDEIHHASKPKKASSAGHPYRTTLMHHRDFFNANNDQTSYPRPRLIGLTASLINSMPKDRNYLRNEVLSFEKLVDGSCITNIEVFESRPKMIIHRFSAYVYGPSNDLLTRVLFGFETKLAEVLKDKKITGDRNEILKMQTYHARLQLAARGISIKPSSFPKIIQGLLMVRQRCGIWALEAVCRRLVEALEKPHATSCMSLDTKVIYSAFTEVIRQFGFGLNRILQEHHAEEILLGYTTAKPLALLDVLKIEYDNFMSGSNQKDSFSCIIFVRSRLEVTALCQWLQYVSSVLPEYCFIKCDYAIGLAATMASKYSCITKRKPAEQTRMLEKFRNGELNVIVTTSVLEEGIDLPVCSTVIRYDTAANFREYVQSRGRARQRISSFVTMSDEAKCDENQKNLNILNDFEFTLKDILSNHDVRNEVIAREASSSRGQPTDRSLYEVDIYSDPDKTVRITGSVAKVILHMYCQQLLKRTPFSDKVRFDRKTLSDQTYQTSIYMPSGCPLEGAIMGSIKKEPRNADNSALVAVIAALVEAKELSPNGVPFRINDENLDGVLDQHHLKPVYEPIESNTQFGLIEKDGDREIFIHKPVTRTIDDYMSKNHSSKTYTLVPLRFVGADNSVRYETRRLMETPVLGLIFDSSYDTSFIPEFIYTHYGKFEVLYRKIASEIFTIEKREDHSMYLNFTYRLLTRCLGFDSLTLEAFRYHCQFYIAPLNQKGLPDRSRIEKSFTSFNYDLRVGDVVKMRRYSTGRGSSSKLMIVRNIRMDMDARSFVPGKRERVTFLQDAEDRYGEGVVTRQNQPIIEVMPLSNEFGRLDTGKRRTADYRGQSLFYLEQFLEFFDENPALVMQAFTLPAIVYRLYHQVVAADLDRKFLAQTSRERSTSAPSIQLSPLNLGGNSISAEGEREVRSEANPVAEPTRAEEDFNEGDADDSDESGDGSESGDGDESWTESDVEQDDDTDYDSDSGLLRSYEEMISAKRMDLLGDNDEDQEHMQKWDFSKYSESNLRTLDFTLRSSHRGIDQDLDWQIRQGIGLGDFETRLEPHMQNLITQLKNYQLRILSESGAYEEDSEFGGQLVSVDRSIEPPFRFECASTPLLNADSRIVGLQESLTFKNARQNFNLETLENVGDSYLKYLTSVVVYQNLEGNEGILTAIRSRLTSNKNFTYLARRMKLGTYAIRQPFSKEALGFALGRDIQAEEISCMNRLKSKDLADLFESIVGSYLVYQGEFEAVLVVEWLGLHIFKEDTFTERSANRVRLARAPNALANQSNEGQKFRSRAAKVEKILGYNFQDREYLIQALTHASYIDKYTRSYERLEYLGDAVLDYLTTATLFSAGVLKGPGQMTCSRSAVVNNAAFARLALKYKFDQYLLYFNHEIFDELVKVRVTLEEDPDMACFDQIEFDGVVKLLADLFESIAGAIYLDSGCSLDAVWSVYYPMMKDNIDRELSNPSKNYIMLLYETFPGPGRIAFETYDLKTEDGDMVGVKCVIRGYREFEGRGLSRRQAKQRAVIEAMACLPEAEEKERLDREFRASQPRVSRGRGMRGRGGSTSVRGRGGRGGGFRQRGRGGQRR